MIPKTGGRDGRGDVKSNILDRRVVGVLWQTAQPRATRCQCPLPSAHTHRVRGSQISEISQISLLFSCQLPCAEHGGSVGVPAKTRGYRPSHSRGTPEWDVRRAAALQRAPPLGVGGEEMVVLPPSERGDVCAPGWWVQLQVPALGAWERGASRPSIPASPVLRLAEKPGKGGGKKKKAKGEGKM